MLSEPTPGVSGAVTLILDPIHRNGTAIAKASRIAFFIVIPPPVSDRVAGIYVGVCRLDSGDPPPRFGKLEIFLKYPPVKPAIFPANERGEILGLVLFAMEIFEQEAKLFQ
jgi:hypothetical protein